MAVVGLFGAQVVSRIQNKQKHFYQSLHRPIMYSGNGVRLLTGNSHPELAKAVAERLGIPLTSSQCTKFADQEIGVRIHESVRDEDVFILQSPSPPSVNDHLMELLILISACKTASARRITAVIPCYPYARQDKKDKSRAPITAKLVANLLTVAGADHVITMDLHASQIQGFFDIPVDNIFTEPLMVRYIKTNIPNWKDAIIVSPDAGGAKRATALADRLGLDFALINRKRAKREKKLANGEPEAPIPKDADGEEKKEVELLVGDVKGKVAILIDDLVDTGRTISLAAQVLNDRGAKEVWALIAHGLLSETSMAAIQDLPLKKLVVTNTLPQTHRTEECKNDILDVVDVSATIAESIRRTHNGESISLLFSEQGW
ncbi:phosphoribosyl pyrophosphokinase [Phaffia rhodozyma]|uniref:ribose-phosphate diphosphokinase n=1 Tax=Phaffia rhodozyma TaxID=264483 RepID=A0A0F7SS34_PHARH|nr:phosphoribosyl pyrophosphokinase [Phaffia rhodozyma]